jgi:RluA family pseudouridine synthase
MPAEPNGVVVGRDEHRLRIDRFLKRTHPRLSHNAIDRLLRTGRVLVNGRPRTLRYYVKSQDRIVIAPEDAAGEGTPGILLATPELVVVAKPPGYSTNPAGGVERNLLTWLAEHQPEPRGIAPPGIIHRLDRETSGLVLFSRSPGAHRAMLVAFRKQRIRKQYLALVAGTLAPPRGEIDLPLHRDRSGRVRPSPHGKPARTGYRTLSRSRRASLLEITPRTGRMHQIRVHLAARDRPIAGDPLYGDPRRNLGSPRLWLHASQLTLPADLAERVRTPRRLACPLWDDLKRHLSEIGFDYIERKA